MLLQDAEYIAGVLEKAIEKVGVDHVVQVITDSAASCVTAGKGFIMEK